MQVNNGIIHVWIRQKMPFSGKEVETFAHLPWNIPEIKNEEDWGFFSKNVEKTLKGTSRVVGRDLTEWAILNITKFPI